MLQIPKMNRNTNRFHDRPIAAPKLKSNFPSAPPHIPKLQRNKAIKKVISRPKREFMIILGFQADNVINILKSKVMPSKGKVMKSGTRMVARSVIDEISSAKKIIAYKIGSSILIGNWFGFILFSCHLTIATEKNP